VGFDLSSWWAASMAEFDRSLLRFHCRVRVSPEGRRRLPDVVGELAAAVEVGPEDDDGWVSAELKLESEDVALSQLIGLGSDVEVLEPSSLREGMRTVAERMLLRHG